MTPSDDITLGLEEAPPETGVSASGVPSWRGSALVPTLVFVTALVAIVSSLGAPLITTIATDDHVSLSTAQWLLTAALLTGALATPVMGRLADGPRQRAVILVALTVVLCGCVLAAVADSFILVVVGRGMQGCGLGLLPVTMAIARRHLSFEHAGRAIATLSITVAVGGGLGYPITGLIVEVFNYHAAYWFGAIMVAGAIALAVVVLPARSDVPRRDFDLVGAGILSIVVAGLLVVLSEGGDWGWLSAPTLIILATSIVMLGVWIPHELRSDDPLVDLRQVRNRLVLTADISGFLLCISMYLFLPITVELAQIPRSSGYGFGESIVISSLVFLPLSAGTFAASRCLELFERRFGRRGIIPLGSLILAAANTYLALNHHSLWQAFVAAGFVGIGLGLTFAAMPGFIVRAVPRSETGSATGFYQVLRNIGLSVGSALGAAVLAGYTLHGHTLPQEGGIRTALLVSAALCLATAIVSFALPGRAADRPASETPEESQAIDRVFEEEAEFAGVGSMLAEEHVTSGHDAAGP
jgi:MFS family permease